MVCLRSGSILASAVMTAIVKLSLGGEASVKLGLESEVCSSCGDDASLSLLQKRGRSLATQGSSSIHAGQEAPAVNKVLFIRTHFTGSSAFAGILRRYCEIHNTTCGPHMDFNTTVGMVKKSSFLEYAEQNGDRDQVQVWEDHMEFEPEVKGAFDVIMPGAVKVSLFREPMARLISGFSHDFITTEMVRQIIADLKSGVSRPELCRAMSKQVPSLSDIDVVGMSDDFERSMVFIAMKLGWDLEDVLYQRVRESPQPSPEHQQALDELKYELQKPLSTLPEGSREFVKVCYLDDFDTYAAAKWKYQTQLAFLTPQERAELEDRVARLHVAFETLKSCCEETPDDKYCDVMMQQQNIWGRYPRGWLETHCRQVALSAIRA